LRTEFITVSSTPAFGSWLPIFGFVIIGSGLSDDRIGDFGWEKIKRWIRELGWWRLRDGALFCILIHPAIFISSDRI